MAKRRPHPLRERLRHGLLAALMLVSLVPEARAETAYIAARLEVGLHEERSAHSAILDLLPEGTEVEVLERDGSASRVRLGDGREGWVVSDYLSSEASAPVELARLQGRVPELEAALEREQAARQEAESGRRTAEEALARLRDDLAARGEDGESGEDGRLLGDLELLTQENRLLEDRIAELEEAQARAAAQSGAGAAPQVSGSGAGPPGFFERPFWHWLLIGFVLLFAFGLGAYVVDWAVRRRHGGYRI